MAVYLIRHTTPQIEKGICYGQSDIPLQEDYMVEFQTIKEKLKLISIDQVYSSPLTRCKLLAKSLSPTVILDHRLMEVDFGSWELKPWDAIASNEIDPWMKDFVYQKPPLGESYLELQERMIDFYQEISEQTQGVRLVISHAGPIRALLSYLKGIALKDSFDIKVPYGSVFKIIANDFEVL